MIARWSPRGSSAKLRKRRKKVPEHTPDAAWDDLAAAWHGAQRELRGSVSDSTYRLWFDQLRPVSRRGPILFLTGPRHVLRWVGRRYPELVRAALLTSGSGLREFELIAPENAPERSADRPSSDAAARVTLNPAYTFERFVIGPGNQLAHAAALAVAERPGEAYNPLFLHGPPGLGKTHLLGSIANYLHAHNPGLAVQYTTAECFTNEFVSSLHGGMEHFKQRYRRADILLIDDVQFLEGKARTADEFFHTFNALYEGGAQLVFTADRLPSELSALAERLRDRFEWGLTAAIEPPDLATRLVFLANLARDRGQQVAPDALRVIAARAAANLRLLEGALTRVLALGSLTSSAITADSVGKALPAPLAPPPDPRAEVAEIQQAVAARVDIPLERILSPNRAAPVARARQLAMYLTRELTDLSLPAIATAFNRRDHTTVINAIRRVEARALEDAALSRTLDELTAELAAVSVDRDRTD